MTGLVIPYDAVNHPFAALTNWSSEFPFEIQGVKYPSVNHYIFCKMTNQKFNSTLLAADRDNDLRQKFNRLSNNMYMEYVRQIIQDGVQQQFIQNRPFRQYFLQRPDHYFYYISNTTTLWGINEDGYGYNLLGHAYSRLLSKNNSSYYKITELTIHQIYRANVLMIHHLQQGNDILVFMGKPVEVIGETLGSLYPNKTLLSSKVVFDNFKNDAYFQNIQYEIDYPWNLAGFVRKEYIQQINYYLRIRFNTKMISKYFEHVLQTKFKHVIDTTQMSYYVQQQLAKLGTQKFQDLSDRLFAMYNHPLQNEKVLTFLDSASIQELYDIEVQFLNSDEIAAGENFVPFLYNIKPGKSIYIYDEAKTSNLEPSTAFLSPLNSHHFTSDKLRYDDLVLFIFVQLTTCLTNLSVDKAYALLENCEDVEACQQKLEIAVRMYKVVLMKKGMAAKFASSLFPKYLLYNTIGYQYDVDVQDPDPVFSKNVAKHLLAIRQGLTEPFYSISFNLIGNNMALQDRIRFRLQDLVKILDAYKLLKNKQTVDISDYRFLQTHLWRNPDGYRTGLPVPPEFLQYFEGHCTNAVTEELWNVFETYAFLLRKNMKIEQTQPLHSIPSILAYFLKTFYKKGQESAFYDFVLSILIGRDVVFQPSSSYYTTEMEREFTQFIPVEAYDVDFIVNMMGVAGTVQRNISLPRHRYFSYWGLPVHTPEPFPSSLASRISAIALVGRATEQLKAEKKKRKKNTEMVADEEEEEVEEEEEEEMGVKEMLQELGLEDDEDEEDQGGESDMETEFGEM